MSEHPATRRFRRLARPVVAALLVVTGLALPAATSAHPLGNYTINHHHALVVGPDRIAVDSVIDMAEIPTFAERRRLDLDGDGEISPSELERGRIDGCEALADDLDLRLAGSRLSPSLVAAGLSFPSGAGGLPTLRLVCEYVAIAPGGITEASTVTFTDEAYPERLGWREVVAVGDRMTLRAVDGAQLEASRSNRLTAYPTDLLADPLDVRRVALKAVPGGPLRPPVDYPDAWPLGAGQAGGPSAEGPPAGAVPGDSGEAIPGIFRSAELSPLLVLLSVLLAAGLGAGHALTPGHGKTLMAAALIGARGTVRQAVGLGLSVAVSHTIGILALAILVAGADAVLPADLVVRILPLVAAAGFVVVGVAMSVGEVRRWRARRRSAHEHGVAPASGLAHTHDEHGHTSEHGHGHGHEHRHEHEPRRPPGWRGLATIGLVGGLIPSTNALLILLAALAAGRAAYGIVLVGAFGLGMAAVLAGLGAAVVIFRDRMDRPAVPALVGRLAAAAPLAGSAAVLVIGLWLSWSAATALPIT